MALVTYGMDAGPESAAITAANSGASVVGTGSTGTAQYKAAAAAVGSFGARLTNIAGQTMTLRFPLASPNVQMSASYNFHVPSGGAPATNMVLHSFRWSGGATCNIVYATNGNLEFWRTTSTKEATILPAASVSSATYYRMTVVINSSTGAYLISIYPSSTSTTPVVTPISGTAAGFNSTSAFTDIQFQIGTVAMTVDVDDLKINDGSSAEIVPGANIPPTVTVPGAQDVAAGATVSLTGSAADGDGTVASRSWSVIYCSTTNPTLSGATTDTVTFTAPAAGNLVILQYVATDNSGGTSVPSTGQVEVRVPSAATNVDPLPGAGNNASWVNTGGAASAGAALADASDTTYVESPSYTATASELRQRLAPMSPRTGLSFTNRAFETATGGVTKFRLYEGSTLRQEWTVTQVTGATDEVYTVTDPTQIVDWGNLWVAMVVST